MAFLNTDYNLDTTAVTVQKAVRTVTLIFLLVGLNKEKDSEKAKHYFLTEIDATPTFRCESEL